MSKTVKRLPLTVQDLTTQASNEFITSYLQAQPRLATIQAGFGDWVPPTRYDKRIRRRSRER